MSLLTLVTWCAVLVLGVGSVGIFVAFVVSAVRAAKE